MQTDADIKDLAAIISRLCCSFSQLKRPLAIKLAFKLAKSARKKINHEKKTRRGDANKNIYSHQLAAGSLLRASFFFFASFGCFWY
jgi:hypothetical protein